MILVTAAEMQEMDRQAIQVHGIPGLVLMENAGRGAADALLDHTIDGYKAMPPMGMCMDCSEEQFIALIEYMTGSTLE